MATDRRALQPKIEKAVHLHRQNDLAGAERLYRQVLAKDGSHLVALHLLGALLLQRERNREAFDLIRRAATLAPDQAFLHANLGEAHRRLGDHASAITSLQRAVALDPSLAEAHHTMGLALRAQARLDDAIASFRRAVLLKPALLAAHTNLADALYGGGHYDEAVEAFSRALEVDGQCAEAHQGLGVVLKELGRIEDAVESLRRAVACKPEDPAVHSQLVYALGLHPAYDAASIAEEATRWRDRHAGSSSPAPRAHPNDRDAGRRLRVGYVSPDFRNHAHSLFLIPLLEHHDRGAVEVFSYSLVGRPDDFTRRIRDLSDHFREMVALPDAEADEMIRGDRIDLLVDVTMHLPGNRLALFARKPAPVQAAWLAYPGTTGVDAIDYRITDVFLDPAEEGADRAYAEESIRLPETFWCYSPLAAEPEVSPSPALRDGRVTFGCLSHCSKTHAGVFALWARVLREVDGSRLLTLGLSPESRKRVRAAFAGAGVDPERIEFLGYQPRDAYLRVYQRIDIGLDTFPHNGGTTSLDAFWMGVPVVTLVGRTVVGRAGLCYASNLGLHELVATTPDQFVEAAARLASDLPSLSALRRELRSRIERSPLMDAPRFAHNLETAYRTMWRRWCEQSVEP